MRLFLDTSVLLAASGSTQGASREVFRRAAGNEWALIATPFTLEEAICNLPLLGPVAGIQWARLRPLLVVMDDVVTLDRPSVFAAHKDRPILFGALAWADVLLTLDREHFGDLLGRTFYDMPILKPGDFLERERAAGRLR